MTAFSINRIILVGNTTRDCELKYTPNGTANASFGMATSRRVKSGDEWKDYTTFHRVVVWGKLAELIGDQLKKGMKVYVEGRVDNRSYENKDGEKKNISEVVAENVIPFDRLKKAAAKKEAEPAPDEGGAENNENVNPEDLPF